MPFPTAHALLIGIGTYQYVPRINVPITVADANAVAAVLRDPQCCGYRPEQVRLLSDATASRAGILATLDSLAAQVGEGDTVFVFYAGHGEYGDDGYYLTTHDTQLDGRKVLTGSGLREAELIAKLRAIKAKRLLLIVNACHSGEISPVLAPSEAPQTGTPLPSQIAAALLGTGEGRVIISACRENQYAFIGPGPLSLFTQALVDGLQGKGVSSNRGYISLFDLYTHLYFALEDAVPRKVAAWVRQHYGEKQEPELTMLKGVGPFAVALYRGATTLGDFDASGSPPNSTAVREVNPAYSQAMLR
ncbi:MAG: caspase family protein, partial [Chloroflexales bacterium]